MISQQEKQVSEEEHEESSGVIEQEYEVEYIYGKLRHRIEKNVLYAVKWEGFPKDQTSWEPLENFVNQSEMCVKRFERCLSYQLYYTQKKRTTTNGIRIHLLGTFGQVYVPEILFMKPRPESVQNRDARPIIKKLEKEGDRGFMNMKELSPIKKQTAHKALIIPGARQQPSNNNHNIQFEPLVKIQPKEVQQRQSLKQAPNDEKREEIDDTKQENKFLGKFKKHSNNDNSKIEQNSSVQMPLKSKLNDSDAGVNHGREKESILPKIYQEQLRQHMPSSQMPQLPLIPSNKYKLLQTQQQPDNVQSNTKDRPKIKTERDYLNEIINAQRIKEQQMKTSLNQSMQAGPNYNFQAKNGDQSINVKLSTEGDENGKTKVQDNSKVVKPISQESGQLIEQSCDIELQCDLEALKLKDNLYKMEKKGARFLQLRNQSFEIPLSMNAIITHSLAQINGSKKVKLVFQVRLSELNQIMFTTMDYLQEMESLMLIDYCLNNALFH